MLLYEAETGRVDATIDSMTQGIQASAIGWTQLKITLAHLRDSFSDETIMDAQLTLEEIRGIIDCLADVCHWPFLHSVEFEVATGEHLHQLDLYEQWCDDLAASEIAWTPAESHCPRPLFRERIILHAYSGRRRPGDFQWYLDRLAAQHGMVDLYVVSIDLVINATWGDIGRPETQRFWLRAIAQGQVLGMLSGPPCCTWSIARGKTDPKRPQLTSKGPRIIRTLQHLWGLPSVSLREMLQLCDGHLLLGFCVQAMVLLSTVGGIGILEHPREPDDPNAASIWRLPLIRMVLNLPGFRLVECAQGLLGATSAKGTGLMTLNLPELPIHIRDNAVRPELPRAATIGTDEAGRFKTAILKEYPPALCKAFAEGFFSQFPSLSPEKDLAPLPAEFLARCQQMTATDMGTNIGADFAG